MKKDVHIHAQPYIRSDCDTARTFELQQRLPRKPTEGFGYFIILPCNNNSQRLQNVTVTSLEPSNWWGANTNPG
ncbi:MAG: hypothetical protein WD077_12495 [Bacteroidia bacterium]